MYRFAVSVGVVVATLLSWWGLSSLVSEGKAHRAVETLGYTNVQVVDRSVAWPVLSGCGVGDMAVFSVRGNDPRDAVRTVTVCAGVFKGGTVRSK